MNRVRSPRIVALESSTVGSAPDVDPCGLCAVLLGPRPFASIVETSQLFRSLDSTHGIVHDVTLQEH